jgi:hypothetical protein
MFARCAMQQQDPLHERARERTSRKILHEQQPDPHQLRQNA